MWKLILFIIMEWLDICTLTEWEAKIMKSNGNMKTWVISIFSLTLFLRICETKKLWVSPFYKSAFFILFCMGFCIDSGCLLWCQVESYSFTKKYMNKWKMKGCLFFFLFSFFLGVRRWQTFVYRIFFWGILKEMVNCNFLEKELYSFCKSSFHISRSQL